MMLKLKFAKYLMLCLISSVNYASSQSFKDTLVYQYFWQPMFHGERLAFCNETKDQCGQKIAQQYCCINGYAGVHKFERAPNLGLTRYISGKNECQGWQCAGFNWIQCLGHRRYTIRPLSDYRQALFVYPRWRKFRLAWCLNDTEQQCNGHKAAYRFCRWQGYEHVLHLKKEKVFASRTIDNNALCIHHHCYGFRYIICKR